MKKHKRVELDPLCFLENNPAQQVGKVVINVCSALKTPKISCYKIKVFKLQPPPEKKKILNKLYIHFNKNQSFFLNFDTPPSFPRTSSV